MTLRFTAAALSTLEKLRTLLRLSLNLFNLNSGLVDFGGLIAGEEEEDTLFMRSFLQLCSPLAVEAGQQTVLLGLVHHL